MTAFAFVPAHGSRRGETDGTPPETPRRRRADRHRAGRYASRNRPQPWLERALFRRTWPSDPRSDDPTASLGGHGVARANAADPQLRRHQPHQAPHEGFFQCIALERLLFGKWSATTHVQPAWSMSQDQEPRRIAIAAEDIPHGASVMRGIDAGPGDGSKGPGQAS